MKWTNLTPILSPIKWAVVGAVATRHYMPERTTQDLDGIISIEDGNEARQKLIEAGFEYQSELTIGGASWLTSEGNSIDLLESKDLWIDDALFEAQKNTDLQGLPIIPLQYLVLMKYQAARPQDIADISRMLGQANEHMLHLIRETFKHWSPAGMTDLESLILSGKLELQ